MARRGRLHAHTHNYSMSILYNRAGYIATYNVARHIYIIIIVCCVMFSCCEHTFDVYKIDMHAY